MPERIVACYRYCDIQGRLLYEVVRYRPKRFEVRDEVGVVLPDFPRRTVLYRLPELRASGIAGTVFLCEGEKDADRLVGLGLVATTCPGGCRLA